MPGKVIEITGEKCAVHGSSSGLPGEGQPEECFVLARGERGAQNTCQRIELVHP